MGFEPVKSIEIDKVEVCEVPSPHVRYHLLITAQVKSWGLWKRYSEFDKLDQALSRLDNQCTPTPVKLPPKTSWFSCTSFCDEILVEGRQLGLEAYLRALLINPEPKWRESLALIRFLEVPAARSNLASGSNSEEFVSSEGWLQELRNCQGVVRDVRAQLIQRENAFQNQNLGSSHQLTAQTRKLAVSLGSRLAKLERELNKLHLTPGEVLRRQDILNQLFHEQSLLSKLISKTQPTEGGADFQSDKSDLLSHPPKTRRVFGRAAQETNETRPLDNEGLLQLQKAKMEQQDQYLTQFSSILARQHQIGTHIGQELETHNQLLHELDSSVASTDAKIRDTTHNARKIS